MVLPREFSVADAFPSMATGTNISRDKDETASGNGNGNGNSNNDDTVTVVDGDELVLTTQGRPRTAGAFLDAEDDAEDGHGLADELIKARASLIYRSTFL